MRLEGISVKPLARVIPIAPSSEPVRQSNVCGLTLDGDCSHCVPAKWVLFKPNPCPGTRDSSPDFR